MLLQLGDETLARLVRVGVGVGVGAGVGVGVGVGVGAGAGVGVRAKVTSMHGGLIAPSGSSPMAAASTATCAASELGSTAPRKDQTTSLVVVRVRAWARG